MNKDTEYLLEFLREIGVAIEEFNSRYPEIAYFELTLAQIQHTLNKPGFTLIPS